VSSLYHASVNGHSSAFGAWDMIRIKVGTNAKSASDRSPTRKGPPLRNSVASNTSNSRFVSVASPGLMPSRSDYKELANESSGQRLERPECCQATNRQAC